MLENWSLSLDLWIQFIFFLFIDFLQDTEDDPGSPTVGLKIKRSVSTAPCNIKVGQWLSSFRRIMDARGRLLNSRRDSNFSSAQQLFKCMHEDMQTFPPQNVFTVGKVPTTHLSPTMNQLFYVIDNILSNWSFAKPIESRSLRHASLRHVITTNADNQISFCKGNRKPALNARKRFLPSHYCIFLSQ